MPGGDCLAESEHAGEGTRRGQSAFLVNKLALTPEWTETQVKEREGNGGRQRPHLSPWQRLLDAAGKLIGCGRCCTGRQAAC